MLLNNNGPWKYKLYYLNGTVREGKEYDSRKTLNLCNQAYNDSAPFVEYSNEKLNLRFVRSEKTGGNWRVYRLRDTSN